MLILTGDDLGRDRRATDACVECYRRNRITSASIMVFMEDSERAAERAIRENLETGLHLNFVLPYDSPGVSESLRRRHRSTARFFRAGPWTQAIYNPFITRAIVSVFEAQVDEYRRLFGKEPAYFNGHKHFHLSLNLIIGKVLPPGSAVRRSFTFYRGEKSRLNRCFRRMIDMWLQKRYVTTDSFFGLSPVEDLPRLSKIIGLAKNTDVELMAHPWRPNESEWLMGKAFLDLIEGACLGNFTTLKMQKSGHFGPNANQP